MKIETSAFKNEGQIPARFTCDGEDLPPILEISGVPAEAKSLAVVVDDPDAPAGTWVHWTVWNVPAAETVTVDGAPSGSVQGVTSFGKTGYGGPCPPSGTHRYYFKAFALDCELELPPETMSDGLMSAMEGHVLERTHLIGLYGRE